MQGAVVISIVLICSVLASLAVGVLVAFVVCVGLFSAFRIHAQQVRQQRQQAIPQTIRPAA